MALAGILSAMPGLGQIYVGYYPRGFVHVLVVASIIALLNTGDLDELTPLAGLFLAFFWLYNIIDAMRRATFYNLMLAGTPDAPDLPRDFKIPSLGGSITGGIILIVGGVILLSHTRFDMPLDWVAEWWPLAPVAFGVYLLAKAIHERQASRPDEGRRSRAD